MTKIIMSQPNAQTASGAVPSSGQLHPETRSQNGSSESTNTQAQVSTTQNVPNIDYAELSRVMMPGLVQGVSNILGEQIRGAITELKDEIKKLPTGDEMKEKIEGLRSEVRNDIQGLRNESNENIGGLRSEIRNDIQELRNEMNDKIDSKIDGLRSEVRNDIQGLRNEMNENIGRLRTEIGNDILELRIEVHEQIKGVREEVKTLRTDLQDKIQDLHEEMHEQLADVQLSIHGLADANMDELHNTVGEMQDEFGELRIDMHKTFDELRKDTIPVIQNLSNRLQDMNYRVDVALQRHVDGIVHLRGVTNRHSELLTEVGLDVMKMGTSNSAVVESVRVTLQTGLNDLLMKMAAMKDNIRNNIISVQDSLDAMDFNNVARLCNSRITGPMTALYPLHNRANQEVEFFPLHSEHLASLHHDHVVSLAAALNLRTKRKDNEADLRGTVARHIGLTGVAS